MMNGGRFNTGRFAAGRFGAGRFSGAVAGEPAALAPPVNLSAPQIAPPGGSPAGTELRALAGAWSGSPAPIFAYQWKRGASDISGETSNSYRTVPADLGESISCVVTASNPVGSTVAASDPVSVLPAGEVPINVAAPSVTPAGVQAEGTVLMADAGVWTGVPAPVLSCQWCRDGLEIEGASGESYAIGAPDSGAAITVQVTASNSEGSVTAVSNTVQVPARSAPVTLSPPVISGSGVIPATLTASAGVWEGNPAPSFAYQWVRGSSDIPGATGASYVTGASDDGATIICRVTASNSQGSAIAISNGLSVAASQNWPASVLATHVGRSADISATRWDDASGKGNHMALVGSPVTAADGAALVVRFDGATQSGVISDAAARWNGTGFDGPVNVAVTARFYPSNSVGVLLGGARASDYAIAVDLNSGMNLVRNNVSNDANVIGTANASGTLTDTTALIDNVDDAMDAAAAMNPSVFQTIVVRNLQPNTAWGGMTFLTDGDGSRLAADVAAVTFWTGSSTGDERTILALHGRVAAGNLV